MNKFTWKFPSEIRRNNNNEQTKKIMDMNKKKEKKYNDQFLRPPTPTKQFLISPPASPPVGWLPVEEATPLLNYDLIHAINKLAPGEAHELHPPSDEHPAIVVHICEDDDSNSNSPVKHKTQIIIHSDDSDDSDREEMSKRPKMKIQQTRAPDSFLKSKDGL